MEVDVRFDSGRISIATETIAIKGDTVLGLNGLIGGNDAALFTLVVDQKNLRNINIFIDAGPVGLWGRGCKWSACYGLLSIGC